MRLGWVGLGLAEVKLSGLSKYQALNKVTCILFSSNLSPDSQQHIITLIKT